MGDHIQCRKPINNMPPEANQTCFPSKSTISSILVTSRKKKFTSATFRGLGGCTASSQVSVIRTSANWEAQKLKKKRIKTKKSKINSSAADAVAQSSTLSSSFVCMGVPDAWRGPRVALTTHAASVDCVVSGRLTRAKVDGVDRILHGQREHGRRMVIPEDFPFLEDDDGLGMPCFRADLSGSRHLRHARHAFSEGLGEIVMFQNNLLMRGRLDRYRDLRLDVDNMSYEVRPGRNLVGFYCEALKLFDEHAKEYYCSLRPILSTPISILELLELGDRIGYVSTGLREDDIHRCLSTTKLAMLNDLSSHFAAEMERKCSICQEEYEADDETGKFNCGHFYHVDCIKQWLGQRNICPICKTASTPNLKPH